MFHGTSSARENMPMPDDLTRRGPEDPHYINLDQDHEVRYWCRKLDCTEEELRDAVSVVGNSVRTVRKYLSLG